MGRFVCDAQMHAWLLCGALLREHGSDDWAGACVLPLVLLVCFSSIFYSGVTGVLYGLTVVGAAAVGVDVCISTGLEDRRCLAVTFYLFLKTTCRADVEDFPSCCAVYFLPSLAGC